MLRTGIIGVGSMGTQHFLRIMKKINGAAVVAVSDINEVHTREIIAPFQGVRFIADPYELINDPEVDAVVIVSVDSTHEAFCIEAVRLGKYVFCEKPLSASADGARRVVDAEMAGGKRLIQMGFNRRFDPGYAELKALITSGKLGEPLAARCSHRNASYAPQYDDVTAVTGTAIHEIDIMSWLVGDYFVKAQSIYSKKSRHVRNPNLHDPQFVILTTSSGIVIDCEIWTNCQYGYDIRCEVLCEDGSAALPHPSRVEICSANTKYRGMTSDGSIYFAESYDREFQAWSDACNADTYCAAAASAWDGYCAAVTTDAVLKAQSSGVIEAVPLTACPDFYQ